MRNSDKLHLRLCSLVLRSGFLIRCAILVILFPIDNNLKAKLISKLIGTFKDRNLVDNPFRETGRSYLPVRWIISKF